ncbi:hypothetical protein M422DRAFT_46242 [Sphaerobolus stellatus SS14]|uniref:PLL-like beta propeller domain-containing protein n=1 Tax=Sphaerobolus stellatus (strain SS14) TaxID=990650 RepID=A0A0C9UTJ8_SPHS4|nr:hypothetical protein M422DRAFT_46242 [Sphaerobolus stellatus SS14]
MTSPAPGQMKTFCLGYDSQLYWKKNTPGNDSAWTKPWNVLSCPGHLWMYEPVSVSRIQNETSVFVVDLNGHGLCQLNFNPGAPDTVTPLKILGGCLPGVPAVTKSKGGVVHIFHVGTDHCLYYKSWNGVAYTPSESTYESLGGTFRDTPAAVSAGKGEVSCFAIGHLDGRLYHYHWTEESGWAKPEKLPGLWGGSLSAVSNQDGHWDVFGIDINGHVNCVSNRKGTISLSEVPSGPFLTVDAVTCHPDHIDLIVKGLNNSVFHRRCVKGTWSGWQDLKVQTAYRPTPISHSPGALSVLVIGMDSILYVRVRDATYGDWSDAGWVANEGALSSRAG